MILSSQLIEDADSPVISNIATLFLFRTQNKKSLEKISKNYNISDDFMSQIQNLDLGSCLTVQIYKSNHRSAFIIRKVIGLNFKDMVKKKVVDEMAIEVGSKELDTLIEKLCNGRHESLSSSIKQYGGIALNELIKQLLSHGADSRQILHEFRKLGFDDNTLSDAFSFAVCESSDEHENK